MEPMQGPESVPSIAQKTKPKGAHLFYEGGRGSLFFQANSPQLPPTRASLAEPTPETLHSHSGSSRPYYFTHLPLPL